MLRHRFCIRMALTALVAFMIEAPAHAAPPDPDRGLYAVWAKDDVFALPYLKGGQIMAQWRDLNPAPGRYDFSVLAGRLADCRRLGRKVTLQVNGNNKPDWLFTQVPYHPDRLSIQVKDAKGTLMFWHPAFVKAYLDFLAAYAEFLKNSPDRATLLGLRLNFNAVGTEHHEIPPAARPLGRWIVPPGVSGAVPFQREFATQYQARVVEAFVKHFSPFTRVFVRNNVSPEIRDQYRALFETGRLGLFHTSSEAEPRGAGTERQYLNFVEFCRSGKTVAYAEPWADAWGYHAKKDPRWCSPPQWNYWRLLCDLHCGVSFIALYGNDLSVALSGRHMRENVPQYKSEFNEAFEFAARYAGFHASPERSPGAWVAFRQSTVARLNNQPLNAMTGDYTFLAERLPDKTAAETNAGPDGQRFGAWARRLAPGDRLRVKLNEAFVHSLSGNTARIKVIYLDSGACSFTVSCGARSNTVSLSNSGRWRTAAFPFPGDAVITLTATTPVSFHMVEVARNY